MENVIEKRRATRRQEDSLVRFEGADFLIYSRMLDVSDHGAFLATHYLLDPGTEIKIYFQEPEGKEFPMSARVVHSSSAKDKEGRRILGLGLEFTA